MKDFESLHQKVQEYISCYSSTDPLKEMSEIASDTTDTEQSALKWIALAVLHGINQNAEKIVISREEGEAISVAATYRKSGLPAPGDTVGEKIMDTVRQMTHAEKDKEKTLLSIGLGNDSLELKIKMKKDGEKDKITFKFP